MSQHPRLTATGPSRPKLAKVATPMRPAPPARAKPRHWILVVCGVLWISVPIACAALYLWVFAADRYVSTLGFSVRMEEVATPLDMLGGLGALGNSSSSDMDILYAYLDSQTLVEAIGGHEDLAPLYQRAGSDQLFSLKQGASIEDLTRQWRWMSGRIYDAGTGLMEVQVTAFRPEEAQEIAERVLVQMRDLVNNLSRLAAEDATRDTARNLALAQDRLGTARIAVDRFRARHQLVDPGAPLETRSGVVAALEGELAQTLVDGDLLKATTRGNDPRLAQVERRVAAIRDRISHEKERLASAGYGHQETPLTEVVGQFERLVMDRSFAEEAYLAARTAHDVAVAEARRQTRYLAVHIPPTLAETPEFPRRWLWLGATSVASVLSWMFVSLSIYALRDRR